MKSKIIFSKKAMFIFYILAIFTFFIASVSAIPEIKAAAGSSGASSVNNVYINATGISYNASYDAGIPWQYNQTSIASNNITITARVLNLNSTAILNWLNTVYQVVGNYITGNNQITVAANNVTSGIFSGQNNYTVNQNHKSNLTIDGNYSISFNSTNSNIYQFFNGTCLITKGLTSQMEVC